MKKTENTIIYKTPRNSDDLSPSSHLHCCLEYDLSFSYPIQTIKQCAIIPTNLTSTEFKNVKFLKQGSNSSIFTAEHCGEKFAVKMLKERPKNVRTAEKELIFEAGILARLRHPNIISIIGVGDIIRKFMVLELLEGGTLSELLQGPAKSPVAQILLPTLSVISMAKSLVSALKYLHEDFHPEAMIIHRDLKPQNIGFTKDGTLKLLDFGLMACVKKRVAATDEYEMSGNTGTVIYMAPEVALRQPYTEKADIYSFGMILWQMTTGTTPFADLQRDDYMNKVVCHGWRPAIRRGLPAPLKEIITRCWAADPMERPACSEILAMLDQAADSLTTTTSTATMKKIGKGVVVEEGEEPTIAGWLYSHVRQLLLKVVLTEGDC